MNINTGRSTLETSLY